MKLRRVHEVGVRMADKLVKRLKDGHVGVDEEHTLNPRPLQRVPDHVPLQPDELPIVVCHETGCAERLVGAQAMVRLRERGLAPAEGRLVRAEHAQARSEDNIVKKIAKCDLNDL
eukprot:CAMPEP_0204571262 /NCGR_PEP_ID=MMETSP0661-20131031/38789_1 /ASSEMBLY_ACC=CAM_ASM_000606 /TAXON_ID=109239 /ORGANISM="Alexandrium margalefi, Strain AMGDE01CS-322" /LENGTH=114 /DNA_ID=CAMNT_0051579509 /DNA_START=429 /DNA_END=773 /DNA_ORIENTATION=-